MFDTYNRLNIISWALLATVIMVGSYLYIGGKADHDIASRERTPAGTVQSVSTASSFWGNTSTLQLDSGKVVILDGTINPWQPGEAVSQPVILKGDSDDYAARLKKTWCVGKECYSQH
ncbi:hypothetical protein [Candidatus Pantoea formicae]|uniref:hypothetical protein n=1 Tax=Candidatus Pantoea formicae TaxID=2608355 RepID=UPI003EDAF26E